MLAQGTHLVEQHETGEEQGGRLGRVRVGDDVRRLHGVGAGVQARRSRRE